MAESFKRIPLGQIYESPAALRVVDRQSVEFQELVASVKEKGVLLPILVRPNPNPETQETFPYMLVDGLQRFTAATEAGLEEVPATVKELSDTDALETQIVANVMRIDTKPVEYTKALQRLLAQQPLLTKGELVRKLGKSVAWLDQRLKLTQLAEEVAKLVDSNKINLSNAFMLSKLPPEEQVNQVDQAMSMQSPEFGGHVAKLLAEITKARREGRTPETEVFSAVPYLRKLSEFKDEQATPTLASQLFTLTDLSSASSKEQVFAAAVAATIAWGIHLDPISVAEGQKKFDEKKAAQAKKKEEAAAARAVAKAEQAVVTAERTKLEFTMKKEGKSPEEIEAALAAFDAEHAK